MKKRANLSFFLFYLAFIGLGIFLFAPGRARADFFSTDSYDIAGDTFSIPDANQYADTTDIQGFLSGYSSPGSDSVNLPITLDPNLVNITPENQNAWGSMASLYSDIAASSNGSNQSAAQTNADTIFGALGSYLGTALSPLGNAAAATTNTTTTASTTTTTNTNDNQSTTSTTIPANTITISPKTLTTNPASSVTIGAHYGLYTTNATTNPIKCYVYIGDGQGTYWPKGSGSLDDSGNCTFKWTASGDTSTGLHTVFVTFQKTDWKAPDKIPGSQSLPTPLVSDVVNACASGSCTAPGSITLSINPNAVSVGQSATLKGFLSNPISANNYASSGQQCYFYIADGKGGWTKLGTKDLSATTGENGNCFLSWSSTGASVGNHSFILNIQDKNKPNGDPTLQPYDQRNITVCAANTDGCKNDGSDPTTAAGGSGGAAGPGGGVGTGGGSSGSSTVGNYSVGTSTNTTPSSHVGQGGGIFSLNPDLSTPEGIYDFILKLFSIIIGILGFFAVVVGGFLILASGGDSNQVTKGKKSIIYGIIGLVIAALSLAIVNVVINDFLNKIGS